MKFSENSSGYDYSVKYTGGADELAKNKRNAVLSSKNTEEIYDIKGEKYYINKDMSLDDIPAELNEGDAVLFERGGLWRIEWKKGIRLPKGVTLGCYGEGDKPKFYGSERNYAKVGIWNKMGENLYMINVHGGNPGIIVFDNEAALGVKKWKKEDLKANYDFFYEGGTEDMYIYYEGDIERDFQSIEIGQRENIITFDSGCVVDNVCVKYCGSHGIVGLDGSNNTFVTNCEIGFVGGSMQFGEVRFGNGIEYQLGCTNATVKNNWVYQCYDAGITFQSWTSANVDSHYYDIDFSDNLIEFCSYGFEYFTTNKEENGFYSDYKNIKIKNNIVRFSGYEWSQLQRPDPAMKSHIRGGQWAYVPDCEGFEIKDNIFDCAKSNIIFWWWHDEAKNYLHPVPHKGLTVSNNTYYQGKTENDICMRYFENKSVYAKNIEELTEAIKKFDQNPKEIKWIDKI